MLLLTDKIFRIEPLVQRVQEWKLNHQKVVFTNGCFDLIHQGHVQYLHQARKKGDKLIVALNSDDSIQRLKGKERPIMDLQSRMEIIASFFFVDGVISFSEDTPYRIIKTLLPDILIKGGDYQIDNIVGKDILDQYGGSVMTIAEIEGAGTTQIIQKILQNYCHAE